ncbi:MAG TPA: hypothetical protein VH062_09965 [Polyangiaceae bacterium]|nr:hypothetical protein [Polyangiaceae bacterium]
MTALAWSDPARVATVRARETAAVLIGVVALAGCAERAVAPPPSPPLDVDRPGAAIPGDLDVAIRLDLTGARRILGVDLGAALALDITDRDDEKTSKLVHDALSRADTAWIAFRPGLSPAATDNVLLVRGEFADLEPHGEGSDWSTPVDLGGAMRVYQRHAPKRRSAPARIYARSEDWFVFVSTAEVDAAERSIEKRAGDEHVDPPDHGIVSVSARTRPLVRLLAPNYPAVAEALEDANSLEGSAAADERGLSVDLSARFTTEPEAARARDRTKLLQSVLSHAKGPFATLAQGASIDAVATNLVVRIRLDAKGFASILGCFQGSGGC